MPWTKVTDTMIEDTVDLSDKAFRLHVDALVYSNKVGLDGRLKISVITKVSNGQRSRDALRELLAAGFWEMDGPDHVTVVRHQTDQMTVAEWQEKRSKEAKRKQRLRSLAASGEQSVESPPSRRTDVPPAAEQYVRPRPASLSRGARRDVRPAVPRDGRRDAGKGRPGEEGFPDAFPSAPYAPAVATGNTVIWPEVKGAHSSSVRSSAHSDLTERRSSPRSDPAW